MIVERDNYVYMLGVDDEALVRRAQRLKILGLGLLAASLGIVGLIAIIPWPAGPLRSFAVAVLVLVVLLGPALAVACLVFARSGRATGMEVLMGRDFLLGPGITGQELLAYRNVRRVKLDVTDGRIVGATLAARISTIGAGLVKDPAILIRAVFEQGSDRIRWYRRGRPFTRLSREEVRELIERSQVPPLQELPLPSVTLARLEDVFPAERGFFRRLFGPRTSNNIKAVTSEPFTPATRYVSLLLEEMCRQRSIARILKRSEPLPVLTSGTEEVAPPPLEDVLGWLKTMCRLDPQAQPGPAEGFTRVEFFDGTRHSLLCRFDDTSDTCCQIRLEPLTAE
jgi:hypothetical protein